MSNVKHLDLSDIDEEILKITVKIDGESREFEVKDPSFATMIASQNAQEAIQAYEKADKTADPNATRVIYVKLAHAILSQNNEITEEEVAKIPFQALLKIAGMMSERVGQPFLEEVSPSTPAKKPKSVKKAK